MPCRIPLLVNLAIHFKHCK